MRLNFYLGIGLLALASALPQTADAQSPAYRIKPELAQMSPKEKQAAVARYKANYPLLANRLSRAPRISPFSSIISPSQLSQLCPGKKAQTPFFSPGATGSSDIWADVAFLSSWDKNDPQIGYYSFKPQGDLNFNLLGRQDSYIGGNGVQLADGHLYGAYLDTRYASYGYTSLTVYNYDTLTWQGTETNLDDYTWAANETAQALDGTVYGEFYNADMSGFNWGTVDYSTMTKTIIAPARRTYVALGITRAGQLYGVATDGNLYKIDKSNGNETLVGPTGLTIVSGSSYYGQTGEIDQRNDTFYWAAVEGTGASGLYTIDLETGEATKVGNFDGQLYGMIIPQPAADDDAPAAATGLSLNFDKANLTGTVSFTMPSTTFAGASLTGDITYTVLANDAVVATGTAKAGEKVNATVTIPHSGMTRFAVYTTNSTGNSPRVKAARWIGYDQPTAVGNLTATQNENQITLTWSSPKTTVHNGYLGDLTYSVYRTNNLTNETDTIAKNITDSTYTDEINGESMSVFSYGVVAVNGDVSSDLATSDAVVVGEAIEPDWTIQFTNPNIIKLFTVLDANNDAATWHYVDDHKAAGSEVSWSGGNDDWLFTPPIHLSPNYIYHFSFKTRNSMTSYTNTMEVKWGDDASVDGMIHTLKPTFAPTGAADTWETYSFEVKADEDGEYYFGFHDNTSTTQNYLMVDSISVTRGSSVQAPDTVAGLSITPAAKGELKATVSFNVPSVNIAGNAITAVDSLQILRNGKVITTLGSQAAGKAITYDDNSITANGTYTYDVIAYSNNEPGRKATASAFVGNDVPLAPQACKLFDNNTNILATWQPIGAIGANGGYVNTDNVRVSFFNIMEQDGQYYVGDSLGVSNPGASTANINYNPEVTTAEDGKTQSLLNLVAHSIGDGGKSGYVSSDALVVGPSIKVPYKESFASGGIDNGFAWTEGNANYMSRETAAGWRINDASSDNDGGSLIYSPYTQEDWWWTTTYDIQAGDSVAINMPKITLAGTTNPVLVFDLYAQEGDASKLLVRVLTPDGVKHDVKLIDLSTITPDTWTKQQVSLSDYINERYAIVEFWGIGSGTTDYIGIDNINVFNQLDYNLAAESITTPETVTAGKTGNVKVNVKNYGKNAADNFDVVLYAGDEAVDTVNVATSLAELSDTTVALTLPVAVNESRTEIPVKAEVVWNKDLDDADNTTEVKNVGVVPSVFPAPTNLTATAQGSEGDVNLKWQRPDTETGKAVTDDFEGYAPFATQLGDWTTVDGDNGHAGGFFNDFNYPGEGTSYAFSAFNPNAMTDRFNVLDYNPGIKPHSGNQFAGSPYEVDDNSNKVNSDDWLISPRLTGKAQTIKFYVLNVATADDNGNTTKFTENFDVLYSTTGTDTTNFVKVTSSVADGETPISEGANWKEITVEIPEGAIYFAIHRNTSSATSFLFGVDDVSYEQANPAAGSTLTGYVVYRDGKRLSTVDATKLEFTDRAASGNHVYNVTALFTAANGDVNESVFSNDASVTSTGIDKIEADKDGTYRIYTVDGRVISLNAKSLDGLHKGVYIINNRKQIVK